MKEKDTKYNCRVFIDKDSQIMIRVRWNQKKNEVGFSIGCFANPEKWDLENQRARYNTTHKLGSKTVIARDINNRINEFLSTIGSFFTEADLYKKPLTSLALKEYVNASLGRIKTEEPEVEAKPKSLAEYFAEFMEVMPIEKNWNSVTHHKYNQMWNQVNSAIPNLKLEDIDKNMMNKLKQWYITNQYNNRTTSRQIRFFKGLLNWIDINGYHIKKEALKYKVNLTLNEKTITFLTSKELQHFYKFEFPQNKAYLERARDVFCFMAFTSLRYSDLQSLKKSNIVDGCLEVITQKTNDRLRIPLIQDALSLIEKYKNYDTSKLFPVASNQKLNDYLKEAAELAGLDRVVVETYYIGNQRFDNEYKFYETISCHDARRTFVCCSIALGIPVTVVMSCTGHADYESMKPYIEVADETQKIQMDKWNTHQYKSQIIEMLDKASESQLKDMLGYMNGVMLG